MQMSCKERVALGSIGEPSTRNTRLPIGAQPLVDYGRYKMACYHFDGTPFKVPPLNSIDSLREAAEQRDRRIRAQMSKPAYLVCIVEAMVEAMQDESTPLGELTSLLFASPIRDQWDLKAFEALRDGQRLGRSIIHEIAVISWSAYEAEAQRFGF
jgi:hypothetical protein